MFKVSCAATANSRMSDAISVCSHKPASIFRNRRTVCKSGIRSSNFWRAKGSLCSCLQESAWKGSSSALGVSTGPMPIQRRPAIKPATNFRPATSSITCQSAVSGTASLAQPVPGALAPIDLDWVARLSLLQEALAFLLPAVLCAVGFALAPPAAITAQYVVVCVGAYVLLVWAARQVQLERLYDARQLLETQLGDSDSVFRDVGGVRVHAKVFDGRARSGVGVAAGSLVLAVHCYHGFGANVASWGAAQRRLAERLAGIVTSHDQPGFGLTQRLPSLSSYTLALNGHLGRAVMDLELAARSLIGTTALKSLLARYDFAPASPRSPPPSPTPAPPSRIRRVLVGHSMGCIAAALEAVASPQDIEAVILVCPAILMPRGKKKAPRPDSTSVAQLTELPELSSAAAAAAAAEMGGNAGNGSVEEVVSPLDPSPSPPASRPTSPFSSVALRRYRSSNSRWAAERERISSGGAAGAVAAAQPFSPAGAVVKTLQAVVAVVKALFVSLFLASLYPLRPLLLLMLRRMVRPRDFWMRGLSMAYYNPQKLKAALVDSYRRPRLVKGFDTALLGYVVSRALGGGNVLHYLTAAITGQAAEDHNLAERLAAAVAEHDIKLLIIHGSNDKLIPLSNSQQLAEAVDGAELVVVSESGHVPHEELPECFVDVVAEFLDRRVLHGTATGEQ